MKTTSKSEHTLDRSDGRFNMRGEKITELNLKTAIETIQ